ncbi:unnamed protein product [Fusarium graminearum]|uniref:Uncharacterized protein n=1 Tax=Gibberella zeae TaxID=5518 RepID=A0A4E9EKA9_GIBZA|nr:unnamed protein product [Fusarium graminearum]
MSRFLIPIWKHVFAKTRLEVISVWKQDEFASALSLRPALPCTRVTSTWLAAGETPNVELCPSSLRIAIAEGRENRRTEDFWHQSTEYLRYLCSEWTPFFAFERLNRATCLSGRWEKAGRVSIIPDTAEANFITFYNGFSKKLTLIATW